MTSTNDDKQSEKIQENSEKPASPFRRIRSFVRRHGRLTQGQQLAIDESMPKFGLFGDAVFDWQTIFGNTNPVRLEIGFGMGGSLVKQAHANPDINYLGIEVHTPGVGSCLLKIDEYKVENLRVVSRDAVEVFQKNIADESLDAIQMFFPDPWPKKRHHKRRLFQPAFLEELRSKLKIGGFLHLATDWENYAEHMLAVLAGNEHFQNLAENGDFIPRPDSRPLTKFEQRGVGLGHGVWDIMVERRS